MADKNIIPIKQADYMLAQHSFRSHSVTVSSKLTSENLQDPMLWVNIAPNIRFGDEIRAIADDGSFMVYLYVAAASGNHIQVKPFIGIDTPTEELAESRSEYFIKQRGVKKWCVIQRSTGDVILEGIDNKAKAEKELQDLQRALAA